MSSETIAAMATAASGSAIGIIRLSGPDVRNVIQHVLHRPDGTRRFASLQKIKARKVYFGLIHDATGQVIDEVLVHLAFNPASYTGEDTAEISGHGGAACQRKLLDVILSAGARHAEPGEFTRRAFLNGKLDLSRAEAVADLVQASGERLRESAFARLRGSLAPAVTEIQDQLLDLAAQVEAWIDFPEDDVDLVVLAAIADELQQIIAVMNEAVEKSRNHVLFHSGVDIAIAGRPNVGKSSLFNQLCGEDRVIVDAVAGTTRDVVSETLSLGGLPVTLHDTAGLRGAEGVEAAGVSRATGLLPRMNLILVVFDGASALTEEDYRTLELTAGLPRILVINRIDLPAMINLEALKGEPYLSVSAKTGAGLHELQAAILTHFELAPAEGLVAANARQLDCLEEAIRSLTDAEETARSNGTIDLVAEGIRQAGRSLSELLGQEYTEDLLDRIFSRFCIGK